jgi:hypothetical protein
MLLTVLGVSQVPENLCLIKIWDAVPNQDPVIKLEVLRTKIVLLAAHQSGQIFH